MSAIQRHYCLTTISILLLRSWQRPPASETDTNPNSGEPFGFLQKSFSRCVRRASLTLGDPRQNFRIKRCNSPLLAAWFPSERQTPTRCPMLLFALALFTNLLGAMASKWVNASISEAQYDQLVHTVHFAKVSYCMNDTTFGIGDFGDECPLNSWCTEYPDIEVIDTIRPSSDNTSGTAYIAADHANMMLYVVFRGSVTTGDWNTDYTFTLCDYAPIVGSGIGALNLSLETKVADLNKQIAANGDTDLCDECKVHCGLMVGYANFMDAIFNASVPYLDDGYNLTVTGHSLGGGYAVFAGLEFKLQGYNPLLITYAALKQGNQQFNSFVDFMFKTVKTSESIANGDALPFGSYARVYNPWDLIPMLPPTANFTKSGLQFELETLDLPQTQKEVYFQGPGDNFVPDNTTDVIALLSKKDYDYWAYHGKYFIEMGTPCSDADGEYA